MTRINITPEAAEEVAEVKKITKSSYNPKNYLNVKLSDGENEKKIKIRIITVDREINKPFKRIKMHTVKVPKEIAPSGYKSYICLNKTVGDFTETLGTKCPFCKLNHDAFENAQKATDPNEKRRWQAISLANKPSDVGILRCIERGHEEDGPKFWKFNIRQDKKDPEGQIRAIYENRKNESIEEAMMDNNGKLPEDFVPENIYDIDNGKDLMVTITRNMDNGIPTDKTSISITDYGRNRPLTEDEEKREEWLMDEKKWSDVFTAKPYEYLKVILEGGTPWFDKEKNVWSTKEEVLGEGAKKSQEADDEIKQKENELLYGEAEEEDTLGF